MPKDKAGNSLEDARSIKLLRKTRKYTDFVGDRDKDDYYSFRLAKSAFVSLSLVDLKANADLALLDQRGKVIQRSQCDCNPGEFIQRSIKSGNYYIRVYRAKPKENTTYRLEVSGFSLGSDDGDGSSGGSNRAQLFRDLDTGRVGSDPQFLTVVGDTLFFAADNGSTGRELWKTDGTTDGTELVRDINPGRDGTTPRSSNPTDLVNVNGVLYFSADDGTNGRELWRSDGTSRGTVLVRDINTGRDNTSDPLSSDPRELVNVNGTLFFSAQTQADGRELWRSDGTQNGTRLVRDINDRQDGSTPLSSDPTSLVSFQNTLYFAADDGTNGKELWRSNGTTSGTQLVRDINRGDSSSTPTDLVTVGGAFYFSADDGINGRELWRSNGTSNGTTLVRDIQTGGETASSNPGSLVNFRNQLYFAAATNNNGRELWRSDGTRNGTTLVRDINRGAESSDPLDLVSFNNFFYFSANNGRNGQELWRSDGTESGTQLVQDIYLGSPSSTPSSLVVFKNRLFFAADNGTNGRELWRL